MFSIVKKATILLSIVILTFTAVSAMAPTPSSARLNDFTPALDTRLTSSRFSQVDDLSPVNPEAFVTLLESDEPVLSNDHFTVYLNRETLAMKVENHRTGYLWNTVIDDVDAGTFDGLLSSSLGFEYINLNQNFNVRQNIGLIDTEFDATITVAHNRVIMDLSIGGFCTSRQCSRFYPEYVAGNPQYDLERMLTLGFINIDIALQLHVTLTDEGIIAHIPYESIVQGNEENIVLSSLMIFPALGATFKDEIPGYMVVPDGIGALMRYQDNTGRFVAPYEERFYGRNLGIVSGRASVANEPLMMPIFGAVHGVRQNAFVAIIEEGDLNARLLAYPAGASNIPYNLIFTKFDFNQTYRQSFTSDGLGGALNIHQSGASNVTVRYDFLSGDDADYVGMALRYQAVLTAQGVLQALEIVHNAIPLFTQYFMADSRARFIGKETIVMTTPDQVLEAVQVLEAAGINHQHIALAGWNTGGYSGHLPARIVFERALGSRRAFDSLFEALDAFEVYLVNNYVRASEDTARISYRRDVAMGVNRFRLERTCATCVYESDYLLYPETSLRLGLSDLKALESLGVNVLHEALAHTLFSYHQRQAYTREDAVDTYQSLMEAYHGIAGYERPMAYAWGYTQTFFDVPLFNSQLKTFDDVVPLLTIVLSGHMHVFSPFLNFNSLGTSQLLRLIDFNIYPSYILTHERSSQLKGSDQEQLFATQFALWQSSIEEEYAFVNEALSAVYGARLVGRSVIAAGLVVTEYDNGVRLVINYSRSDQTLDDITVAGESVIVLGGRP